MTSATKYPHISIPLEGEDGNAFAILGRVTKIMRRNGLADKVDEFTTEATSGDYGNLLRTVVAWFSFDDDEDDDVEEIEFYAEHPSGCFECRELYAVGGCPSCGGEGGEW